MGCGPKLAQLAAITANRKQPATREARVRGCTAGQPAARMIRFLAVRFGVAAATERGGTGNLSESGLFIVTESPVDAGSWLSMALDIDQESIPLRGVVRWANNEHYVGRAPGMGIQLSEPPRPYLNYVRSLS